MSPNWLNLASRKLKSCGPTKGYYSIHRVPANTNGDSYQSTYTVQVRRAYSSLRYSRHRPIRFDSDRVDVIRGDVKRDRQRARDQHEWAPWRYTDGPSTRAFEGPFEAVGLAGRCLGADHFAHRVRHISAPFGRFHLSISLLLLCPSPRAPGLRPNVLRALLLALIARLLPPFRRLTGNGAHDTGICAGTPSTVLVGTSGR